MLWPCPWEHQVTPEVGCLGNAPSWRAMLYDMSGAVHGAVPQAGQPALLHSLLHSVCPVWALSMDISGKNLGQQALCQFTVH